jgi:hypothetical protein
VACKTKESEGGLPKVPGEGADERVIVGLPEAQGAEVYLGERAEGMGVTQAMPIRASHSRSWWARPTGASSMGAMTARASVLRAMLGISSATPLTSASERIGSQGSRALG